MCCKSCALDITEVLTGVAGVYQHTISPDVKMRTVQVDVEDGTDDTELIKAVVAAGWATSIEPAPEPPRPRFNDTRAPTGGR
jgi:copper chaperone CopZ